MHPCVHPPESQKNAWKDRAGRLVKGLTQHRDDIHLPHEGLRRNEGSTIQSHSHFLYKTKNPRDLVMRK